MYILHMYILHMTYTGIMKCVECRVMILNMKMCQSVEPMMVSFLC